MLAKSILLLVMASLLITGAAIGADKYKFDKAHSHIGFKVSHMVISKVNGNFNGFEGTLMLNDSDLTKSSVNVKIDAATIDTDNDDRDKHLRSDEFFNAAKYPEITFNSTKIEKADDGYILYGDLTMAGVTKKVEIPFEFNGKLKDPWGNDRVGFSGRTKVNRQDYGISWNKVLDTGGLTVGNEVTIELEVEAVKQP